jgi:GTP-binding protein EngB required for normal cell division
VEGKEHNTGNRASIMQSKSNAISSGAYLHALPKALVASDTGFRKLRIGPNRIGQISDKVILVVGGTGSGKSTFINAMVNYLYEVDFQHPFRFQVITAEDEEKESETTDEGKSKTKLVSAYELNETRFRYRMTIVDTPGFGDTEGVDRDEMTKDFIRKWFEREDENGLKTIDAVCIVIKGTETRVTPELKHKLYSVQSLLGRDMTENILSVFTFCDSSDPPALKALATDGLLVNDTRFLFNSRGMMEINKSDDFMLEAFYTKCSSSFEKLFAKLDELKPHSVVFTLDVLKNRKALEEEAVVLSEHISQQVSKLQQISDIIKILQTEAIYYNENIAMKSFTLTKGGKTLQMTLEDMFAEYKIEGGDRTRNLLQHLALDLVEQEKILGDKVRSVRERLNRLNVISLRPEQATDSQYIQYLISTITTCSDTVADHNERLNVLQKHLKIVKLLETVQTGGSFFNYTESAAVAYLGHTFPALYKKLRQLGHFPANRNDDDHDWKSIQVTDENSGDEKDSVSLSSEVPSDRVIDAELDELNRMVDQVSLSSDPAIESNPPTPLRYPKLPIWKRFKRFVSRPA